MNKIILMMNLIMNNKYIYMNIIIDKWWIINDIIYNIIDLYWINVINDDNIDDIWYNEWFIDYWWYIW